MTHSSKTVSKAFIDMLEQQEWKGNVRELRNVIERSLIVCENDELHPEDLPIEIQNAAFKEKSCNNSGFELSAMENATSPEYWTIRTAIKPKLQNF